MRDIIFSLLTIASTIDIVLLLVLFRSPSDSLRTAFMHLIAGAFAWNISIILTVFVLDVTYTPFIYLAAFYFFIVRFLFISKYTHTRHPREERILLIITCILAILAFVPQAIFKDVAATPEGYLLVKNGWFTLPFALFMIYMTLRPLQHLINHYRNVRTREVRIITLGMSFYAVITISTNLILPVFFNTALFNTIGPAFSTIFTLFVFYAISRYQFLHIKLIIQRGIIFSALYGFTLALYSTVGSILVFITRDTLQSNSITIALTILIAALLVAPLEKHLRRITDRLLLQQSYSYDEITRELANLFAQHSTTNAILRYSLKFIKDNLRLTKINFRYYAEIPPLISERCRLFSVYDSKGVIGYVLVGEKRSRDPLTRTDIKIITLYTTILGIALEKSQLFEHLEEEVEERTKEIARFRDEERSRLAVLAHDLKTPLTVLLGTHELISKSPEISREQFDMLGKPLRTMRQTINEIAGFESHTVAPHETLELSRLLEGVSEHMEVLSAMEKITFTHSIQPKVYVVGHARDLELMCNNILANAIRYKNAGTSEISLTLTLENNDAIVTIKDNGIGIPAKELRKVMKTGYRARNTQGREGTGTGLATVKKIAGAHNATMHLDSIENVGTVVTFRFQTSAAHS